MFCEWRQVSSSLQECVAGDQLAHSQTGACDSSVLHFLSATVVTAAAVAQFNLFFFVLLLPLSFSALSPRFLLSIYLTIVALQQQQLLQRQLQQPLPNSCWSEGNKNGNHEQFFNFDSLKACLIVISMNLTQLSVLHCRCHRRCFSSDAPLRSSIHTSDETKENSLIKRQKMWFLLGFFFC